MARPQKKGIDYFPFDVDFFDDEKIEAISGEFGQKGELAAIKLLCAIYRNGYFIVWDDLAKMKITRRMHGVSPELLDTIVLRLVKWNFFDMGLFESARVLSSHGIQKRWKEATRKRVGEKSEELEYWLIEVSGVHLDVSGGRNYTNVDFPAEETTQSKVKESKGEESKVNNPIAIGAADRVAKQKGVEFSDADKPPSNSRPADKPPPSSAAPPSVQRDDAGVATCQELRSQLLEYRKNHPGKYLDEMYAKFLRYWSEPNQKGKPRWKTEKEKKNGRFDVPGRLATWKENEDKNANSSANGNRGANTSLRSRSLAEPNYRGEGNVRKVEI